MANPAATTEYKENVEYPVTVAAFFLKGIETADQSSTYAAISGLHQILKKLKNRLDAKAAKNPQASNLPTRVLSALHGAFVIAADTNHICLHAEWDETITAITDAKLPIRIGVVHGMTRCLVDLDGTANIIGDPLNRAARIATAPNNDGLLYEQSYARHFETNTKGDYRPNHSAKTLRVTGKRNETFNCYLPGRAISVARDFSAIALAASPNDGTNATAIAFDLPEFSDGDPNTLCQRFSALITAVHQAFADCHWSTSDHCYAPGGDGGILVFSNTTNPKSYLNLAREIKAKLRAQGAPRNEQGKVNCRIGIHPGWTVTYRNGEDIKRPTGSVCFIADKLADKQPAGDIVFSDELRLSFADGNREEAGRLFTGLGHLTDGPAKGRPRWLDQPPPKKRKSENGARKFTELPSQAGGLHKDPAKDTQQWQDRPPTDSSPVRIVVQQSMSALSTPIPSAADRALCRKTFPAQLAMLVNLFERFPEFRSVLSTPFKIDVNLPNQQAAEELIVKATHQYKIWFRKLDEVSQDPKWNALLAETMGSLVYLTIGLAYADVAANQSQNTVPNGTIGIPPEVGEILEEVIKAFVYGTKKVKVYQDDQGRVRIGGRSIRREDIAEFGLEPPLAVYTRILKRALGLTESATLERLAGALEFEAARGNPVHVRLDPNSPLIAELRGEKSLNDLVILMHKNGITFHQAVANDQYVEFCERYLKAIFNQLFYQPSNLTRASSADRRASGTSIAGGANR